MKKQILTVAVVAAVLLPVGCGGMSRRDQLHRVAKDWCETIRASQVIAVYPLTQDVQPGDVFLVQTPIDEQQRIYKADGFLPLDNHLARLNPTGYGKFYENSFLGGTGATTLPKDWLEAKWASAPSAAFPSYAFTVTKAGGLNMAIPVSGVPVGLSLLATQSASGTITLKDARTVGLDTMSVYEQLTAKWADETPARQDFLSNFGVGPGERPKNYLRVITRVYLLGAIDVQLNDARSFGAGADAGAARPVELFLPETPSGNEDTRRAGQETFLRGVERLNAMGGTGAPTASSGADAGLSADQLAARTESRKTEREGELSRAVTERDEANQAVTSARATADASPEGQSLAQAKEDLETAIRTREDKHEALEAARAERPPDDARIAQAEQELAGAETNVTDEKKDLAEAQKAYDDRHGEAIQKAEGKRDVRQSAVDRLQEFAPGASFRFTAASARSVSMSETFENPLVVGYLGFDVPIGVDGELGRPIPTHALLDSSISVPAVPISPAAQVYRTEADAAMYDALDALAMAGDKAAIEARSSLDRMIRYMPREHPRYDSRNLSLTFVEKPATNFGGYLTYRAQRKRAIKGLELAADRGQAVTISGASVSGDDLRPHIDDLAERSREARAYRQARDRLVRFWIGK
ncbi:MAG: hypothetical protein GY715_11905 [Planctomycetes bacterium]|nr:hypothetical protein [Planctomycetota bacterium]